MQKPSYSLRSAIVAIRRTFHPGDSSSLTTLQSDSTLTVLSEPDHLGLVHVSCEAGDFLVFQQDLELRAIRLAPESASGATHRR